MGKRLKIYKTFRLRWHCTEPSFTFHPPQTRPLLIRINVLDGSKCTTSCQYRHDPLSLFDPSNTLNWVCNLKFSNFCKVVVGFCGHRRYLFCEGFQESISYDFLVLLSVYRSMMVWDGFKHIFWSEFQRCIFKTTYIIEATIVYVPPLLNFIRCTFIPFKESISYDFLVLLSGYRSMMVWDGFKLIFGVDFNLIFSKLHILKLLFFFIVDFALDVGTPNV